MLYSFGIQNYFCLNFNWKNCKFTYSFYKKLVLRFLPSRVIDIKSKLLNTDELRTANREVPDYYLFKEKIAQNYYVYNEWVYKKNVSSNFHHIY